MRVLRAALAGLLLFAVCTTAQAAHTFWVDKNTEGFENPQTLGVIPQGWTASHAANPVTDNTHVLEGNQSAIITGGVGAIGMTRQDTFHDEGEYHWMFYDDMAETKNGRVGLDRTTTFPNNAPRFAAMGVETNQSATNYIWHHSFSFGPTTVLRSEGWRHMYLKWFTVQDVGGPITAIEYYIDDQLGATRFYTAVTTPTAEWVGAPFGTQSPIWVDVIPEPSALTLLSIGMAGVFLKRRRTV